jgi:hypothetical protein
MVGDVPLRDVDAMPSFDDSIFLVTYTIVGILSSALSSHSRLQKLSVRRSLLRPRGQIDVVAET